MGEHGRSYEDVLAEAQGLGYAEADPRGDVEGDDAVNKIVLLARLAFGAWIDPASVLRTPPSVRGWGRPGITGVTSEEMEGAAFLGLDLKLLAVAEPGPGGALAATVLPTAVPENGALGGTDGVLNRVEVLAEPVGDVAFSGPGAGGDPTSSAVLGDLLAIARGGGSTWAGLAPAEEAPVAANASDPFADPRPWFAFLPGSRGSGSRWARQPRSRRSTAARSCGPARCRSSACERRSRRSCRPARTRRCTRSPTDGFARRSPFPARRTLAPSSSTATRLSCHSVTPRPGSRSARAPRRSSTRSASARRGASRTSS